MACVRKLGSDKLAHGSGWTTYGGGRLVTGRNANTTHEGHVMEKQDTY